MLKQEVTATEKLKVRWLNLLLLKEQKKKQCPSVGLTNRDVSANICIWLPNMILYLFFYQLLYVFDGAHTFFTCYVIDIFFRSSRHFFSQHLLALTNRHVSWFATHRQFWKIGARRPQLYTCNAVSTIALDMYYVQFMLALQCQLQILIFENIKTTKKG